MTATPQTIDANTLAAALTGNRRVTLADGTSVSVAPAIVLDLDAKGIVTTTRGKSGVRYDLDGDGIADPTSWIGTTEGFLFLDRDKSGTFDNLAELSLLADLPGAASNLAALKAFDSNGDGVISSADAAFADFMIWQDKNGNGIADPGEFLTMTAAGVKAINLTAVQTAINNADDVLTIAKGSYQRTNGTTADLIDAALSFTGASDGLPKIDVAAQSYDRKAKKYRITAKDGQMSVTGKYVPKDIDSRAGGLLGAFQITFRNTVVGMLSTLVLDLDGNGVSTVGKGRGQGWFDMNGDGSPDETGWTSRTDGFLVIDRNNNGTIDNASELSMLVEDPMAKTSLAALAKLDSNGDKVIDAKDARFGELKIWVDANGNGVTDAGELKSLTDLGIVSINLDAHVLNNSVRPGDNLLIETATFTMANGMIRTLGDVALAYHPSQPDAGQAAALYTPNAPVPTVPTPDPVPAQTIDPPLPVDPAVLSGATQFANAIATFSAPSAGWAGTSLLGSEPGFVSLSPPAHQ